MGTVVMVGWWAHITTVLRISSLDNPMAFNTALAFTITGVALAAAISEDLPMAALVAGMFDGALGAVTLAEYALDRGLGVDELFAHAYVSGPHAVPGRIALNTAGCLVVTGVGLLAWGPWRARRRPAVLAGAGAAIAVIALMAVFGYATSDPTAYGWGHLTAMSRLTAATMVVLAVSLMGAAWRDVSLAGEGLPKWLALPAAVVALALAAGLWITIRGGASTHESVGRANSAAAALGIALAGMVGLTVWFAQVSDARRRSALAEIALRARAEEEALSRATLLDLALDAIFMWDARRIITYWNHGAELTYGYSSEEAVGRVAGDLLDTRFPVLFADIETELATTGTWEGELGQRHKDGRRIAVVARWAERRGGDGKRIATMEVNRDITPQKRSEEERARQAAELAQSNLQLTRSNAELEQFAYVASHDLSEPLRAISGPISMVARRYQGQLDDESDELIGFAVDGCQRMQNLINGLLAFSRVGRLEGAVTNCDCNAIVENVLADLGVTIEESHATVTVEHLPSVVAEANQLRQVFQNLIANAIKFVPPDRPPLVVVTAKPTGNQWRITVMDNGIGIEPRYRERVFEIFRRLHGRDEYPGTGIGLALVKKIVERHGGQVGVEDARTGTGCQFWFTLPAAQERVA